MTFDGKINPAQFKTLSKIVYKESGIVLNDKKYNLLVARVSKRMRITKTDSVANYMKLIASSKEEFNDFIDAATTNHTFFFRENRHSEFLIQTLDNTKPLKIWSAASSSGEEPYSIAVQLLENMFSFSIYASDVSGSMLRKCQKAVYSNDRLKDVPLRTLHKYFQKGKSKWEGYVRVKPEVTKKVTFGKYNLLSDTPSDTYDIIFCRNVMIYFDTPTRQKVVQSLSRALKPGGYFFVGMSENLHGLDHNLSSVLPSGYQKK
ncbi:methyltransferase domain-containing protein [bacterium]|nr:methyltransferase domain-containing protein [bacterium]